MRPLRGTKSEQALCAFFQIQKRSASHSIQQQLCLCELCSLNALIMGSDHSAKKITWEEAFSVQTNLSVYDGAVTLPAQNFMFHFGEAGNSEELATSFISALDEFSSKEYPAKNILEGPLTTASVINLARISGSTSLALTAAYRMLLEHNGSADDEALVCASAEGLASDIVNFCPPSFCQVLTAPIFQSNGKIFLSKRARTVIVWVQHSPKITGIRAAIDMPRSESASSNTAFSQCYLKWDGERDAIGSIALETRPFRQAHHEGWWSRGSTRFDNRCVDRSRSDHVRIRFDIMDKHIDVSVDGAALGNLACNEGAALRKCIEMGKQFVSKLE